MIIQIPLDPQVVAYIQAERGTDPLVYSPKDPLIMTAFIFFRCRIKPRDPIVDPGSSFIEVKISDLLLKQGKTYFSKEAAEEFERIVRRQMEERFVETVVLRRQSPSTKFQDAVRFAMLKFGLTEDLLPYDTLYKRVQRYDQRMQAQ